MRRYLTRHSYGIAAAAATVAALLLTGCQKQQMAAPDIVVEAPAPGKADRAGRWRTEPVIFNGRRYALSWRKTPGDAYEARISAPGRRLGATKGDRRVIREVASAAMHHFNCHSRQRARVSALRPVNGRWEMIVRCR
jgi:hypothetical protein